MSPKFVKLFQGYTGQANQLDRSGEWVNTELKFETHAEEVSDRPLLLGLAVEWQGGGDEALDLYNERLNRFR